MYMNLQTKKLQLIELLLHIEEEAILEKVSEVLNNTENVKELSPHHYLELEERRKRHINEESASYSWNEIKNAVLKKEE